VEKMPGAIPTWVQLILFLSTDKTAYDFKGEIIQLNKRSLGKKINYRKGVSRNIITSNITEPNQGDKL
jgi:hypothetical protein